MDSFVACEFPRECISTESREEGRKKKLGRRESEGLTPPEKKISLLDGFVFLLFLFPCFVMP
jgi:hypothetical protein